jgi:hypothetical protein
MSQKKKRDSAYSQLTITQKEVCALEFFKIAKQDLLAAKVLYRHNLYPEALFFFQQSVEKAYKSYHIFGEIGNRQNMNASNVYSIKDIGHTPTKILEKQASNMEMRLTENMHIINAIPNSEEFYKKTGINFPEVIDQVSKLKQESAKISKERRISNKIQRKEVKRFIAKLSKIIKASNQTIRITQKFL